MLRQFGEWIAWLSGSLAGVSALLYAAGYVATKSADQVLGLGIEFAPRDPVFYIARGGSVIMRTALISVWPGLALVVVAAVLRGIAGRLSPAAATVLSTSGGWGTVLMASASSLAMIGLILVGLGLWVVPALDAEGLLFSASLTQELCAGDNALRRQILTQDRAALEDSFNSFAVIIGSVAGIGIIARSRLLDARQWPWTSLSGLALFLALVGAPIAYGALVVEPTAPQVSITPPLAGGPGQMRLLSRTEDGVLIWLEDQRSVQWIRIDKIDTLTIERKEPIATAPCVTLNSPS